MKSVGHHWPLWACLALLCVIAAAYAVASIHHNQGHLVYPTDDTYIHMAIAKNFALHNTWGITRFAFTSSSSSLLWTLVLSSAYRLWGLNEVTPLLLNCVFAIALLICSYLFIRKQDLRPLHTFALLVAVALLMPMPVLMLTGHEHLMHSFLSLSFAFAAARSLSSERGGLREIGWLALLSPLVVLARFEGLFLVFVVCCLMLARRRLLSALMLGLLAVLPVAVYGAISHAKGWYPLPNSVLGRGELPNFATADNFIRAIGYTAYEKLAYTPHVLLIVIGSLMVTLGLLKREGRVWGEITILNLVFIATTCLHMQFGRVRSFFRYEAYLVALGLIAIAISLDRMGLKVSLQKAGRTRAVGLVATVVLAALIVSPLVARSVRSMMVIRQGTTNIYHQQYQMGLLVSEFYDGRGVALNDIGAVNFLADIRCLDLWGLASLETARARRSGSYNPDWLYDLARSEGIEVAIVYTDWYDEYGGLPHQWEIVGRWRIMNNIVTGGDAVSFYAVHPSGKDRLTSSLREFSPKLPESVTESGPYTE